MNKDFLLAAGLLAVTIIGAGMFSLPYVFSRLGIASGVFYLLAFFGVYFALHLMYARALEAQSGEHQFFYLAHRYLPKWLASLSLVAILAELVFVLVVYLILAPTFIEIIAGPSATGGLLEAMIFWFLGSIFMFARLEVLGWTDILGALSIFGIVGIIFGASAGMPLEAPLFGKMDWPMFFLPFGPLLFSLSGRPAIHKLIEEHRRAKRSGRAFSLGWSVFVGTAIPAVVYLVFVLGVLRLNPEVTPEALNGLGSVSPFLFSLLGWLGLITIWTSYFMIGANVRDIIRLDLKYPRWVAAAAALFLPLAIYFAIPKNFLSALSFSGGVFLGLEGVLVTAIWRRAFPNSGWRGFSWLFFAIFSVAIVQEIISTLK